MLHLFFKILIRPNFHNVLGARMMDALLATSLVGLKLAIMPNDLLYCQSRAGFTMKFCCSGTQLYMVGIPGMAFRSLSGVVWLLFNIGLSTSHWE